MTLFVSHDSRAAQKPWGFLMTPKSLNNSMSYVDTQITGHP
jgi:hypothetical protein